MIISYKHIGETPLDVIKRLQNSNTELKETTLSYAGRLDPLAEGVMLILSGEKENQEREKYLSLPKVYESKIVFGLSTDSYDVLGVLEENINDIEEKFDEVKLSTALKTFSGVYEQAYPPFSSKTIDGTPLWRLARDGKLSGVTLPRHDVEIVSLETIDSPEMSGNDLYEYADHMVNQVDGDFRQKEILKSWEQLKGDETMYPTLTIRLSVSSGFYVRSFAHELGEKIGLPAMALSIKRTHVGEYTQGDITHR